MVSSDCVFQLSDLLAQSCAIDRLGTNIFNATLWSRLQGRGCARDDFKLHCFLLHEDIKFVLDWFSRKQAAVLRATTEAKLRCRTIEFRSFLDENSSDLITLVQPTTSIYPSVSERIRRVRRHLLGGRGFT